jgi:hypothetical protein
MRPVAHSRVDEASSMMGTSGNSRTRARRLKVLRRVPIASEPLSDAVGVDEGLDDAHSSETFRVRGAEDVRDQHGGAALSAAAASRPPQASTTVIRDHLIWLR